jgi:hypothetical protein
VTPLHRTKLGVLIDWGLVLFFLLLAGACVARGQEPPKTICGTDNRNPTPNVDLIQVSCIDFDRLRAQAPDFRWPVGKVTQVLVHIREGDAVRVTVDGVQKFADLIRDAWGRLIALVQFDGTDYKAVTVKVYRAVEE